MEDKKQPAYFYVELIYGGSNHFTSSAANQSKQAADQDLLTHILRSLATNRIGGKNITGLIQESQNIASGGSSLSKLEAIPPVVSKGLEGPSGSLQLSPSQLAPCSLNGVESYAEGRNLTGGQSKLNNFDLNDVYIDSDDGLEDPDRSPVRANPRINSLDCPSCIQQESHQSSPHQTSRTSDSASAQSPSSSSGDTQVFRK